MQIDVQQKLIKDKKMLELLKLNSEWYKLLNRNPDNYQLFEKAMKEKYKLKTTDKVTNVVENIDLISSVLKVLS